MSICETCPRACRIEEGGLGFCKARAVPAGGGEVVSASYGRITSCALDPIEKKPIARWQSGTSVLSIGGYGCNMNCPFCQNDSIARAGEADVSWITVSPQEVVQTALSLQDAVSGRGDHSALPMRVYATTSAPCVGIAYTYNEPLVAWEFARDCAKLAREAGLYNVLVSNGMVTSEILDELAPFLDAANIDLKCYSEEGYRALGGNLETVKGTIRTLAESGTCHVEVTTLVVEGLNDDEDMMRAESSWLASIASDIPLHLTRFFPHYRMSHARPTPIGLMRRLADVAGEYLDDVMLGNV